MNTFILVLPLLALLAGAGCSRSKETTAAAAMSVQPVLISVAQTVSRTVPAAFEVTGTFVADETSDIAPQVAGRIVATPVNVGDFVRQGQIICELDHRDAQLRLAQVKAQLAEATSGLRQTRSRIGLGAGAGFDPTLVPEVAGAKANYESAQAQAKLAAAEARRYQNLVNTGDVSRSTFDKFRTQQETAEAQAAGARQQYEAALNAARQGYGAVESSQASLEGARSLLAQAEKALADTTVRAPFDGYVTARPVAGGEYVALTNKLATLVRIGSLKLQLQTPELRAAKVNLGMTVIARVAAFPDREFTGKVTAINPSVDPNSRIFIVEARFPNPRAELKPGMFSTAHVQLPGGENALFVPREAVIRDRTTDSNQVFVVENNTARLRVVGSGDVDGNQIRVNSGLKAAEVVATTKQSELFDGVPVRTR